MDHLIVHRTISTALHALHMGLCTIGGLDYRTHHFTRKMDTIERPSVCGKGSICKKSLLNKSYNYTGKVFLMREVFQEFIHRN